MSNERLSGFLVASGEARREMTLNFLGETAYIKIPGVDTGGRYTVFEEITPPQGGPPLHSHKKETEWFYVLEGQFLFEMDGRQTRASTGDSVFVPQGTPHTFQNVGDAPGRLLILIEPAGLEHLFQRLDAICKEGPPEMERLNAIFDEFGVVLHGPPLALRESTNPQSSHA